MPHIHVSFSVFSSRKQAIIVKVFARSSQIMYPNSLKTKKPDGEWQETPNRLLIKLWLVIKI